MRRPRIIMYRLIGREVVPCKGYTVEGFMEREVAIEATGNDPWRVGFDELGGGRTMSTVFLGLNHNYLDGPPHVFETMVFTRDGVGELITRYSTWDEAEQGHAEAVRVAKNGHLRVVK